MVGTLSTNDESQLLQTVEMFEIVTQNQPLDHQSLEILKDAYAKLGREEDVLKISRRIAHAYVQLGQLSSAIMEYESILQRCPEDPEVLAAVREIEAAANTLPNLPSSATDAGFAAATTEEGASPERYFDQASAADVDDGRQMMFKLFVESKTVSSADFDLCWPPPHPPAPGKVVDPFIQVLADRGTLQIDKSLKLLCETTRLGFLPMDRYDVDYELTRNFPPEVCRGWCVLPFDKMSSSLLVATANPYNRQAAQDLQSVTPCRLLFYLSPPQDIIRALKKAFR
jgi:hypothetical protein